MLPLHCRISRTGFVRLTSMAERETLRLLRVKDVPAAYLLSAQTGWNQTEEDWLTLLDLAPRSCFAIEIDGQLTATTTLLCYGQKLAWIGMVLTKSEFQRRGLATKLFQHTLKVADEMGIESVKLDATEQGQPLYQKLGFRGEQAIERWSRPGTGSAQFPAAKPTVPLGWETDLHNFGADRLPLLKRLAQRNSPQVRAQSYLFTRPGRTSAYLGPCVSNNPEDARGLISDYLTNNPGSWSWDLFPGNHKAVEIARELGFTPQRRLLRMSRGKELVGNWAAIYAIAGFELG